MASIRQAEPDDLGAVVEVGRRTWPATYEAIAGADYVAMGLAKWWTADANVSAIRAGRVLVAETDGEVVGMASFGPRNGDLVVWKLYVLPEHQGRGLGTALMDAVLERAQGHYPEVQLSYIDGNESAERFYKSRGFVEFDREAGGSGVPESVWLRLPVPDAAADQDREGI
jgi:GNAT superfamily N-acetyltransferase